MDIDTPIAAKLAPGGVERPDMMAVLRLCGVEEVIEVAAWAVIDDHDGTLADEAPAIVGMLERALEVARARLVALPAA
jgi:hypothetical protein